MDWKTVKIITDVGELIEKNTSTVYHQELRLKNREVGLHPS